MVSTGCGSLPGDDFRGALGAMMECFPELTPLPELPSRSAGSAMIGRAASLLVDLPVELASSGWQLADHQGADQSRAVAAWRRDLDDLEELAQGFTGTFKIGVCGPLTLAASLGRPRAEAALADRGARRDLSQSLSFGVTQLMADLSRRLPQASFLVQVDEPMLPAIIAGQVPSASRYRMLKAIDQSEAVSLLRPFGPGAVLHCCSGDDWVAIAKQAGFVAGYLDLCQPFGRASQLFEQSLEQGLGVIAGVAQSARVDEVEPADRLIGRASRMIEEFTSGVEETADWLVLAPNCGLSGWRVETARTQLKVLSQASQSLFDASAPSRISWLP